MPTTAAPVAVGEALAADPFTSLAVHYGMLLGVSDFQAMLANPRGKLRLHQAWQHGPGVVWGFDVAVPDDSTELRVSAGLAVDGVGREVSLAVEHCVDLQQWLAEHEDEAQPDEGEDGALTFNVRLVARHAACLSRPVPAISSACEGGSAQTSWSRILETAELELRPYLADDPPGDDRAGAFPGLRALVRDGTVADGTPTGTWLDAFRAVAAEEAAALGPPAVVGGDPTSSRLFPVDVPGEIVLADLPGLRLETTADGPRLVAPVIDLAVRRTHVPTWLLEELLAELLDAGRGTAAPGGAAVASVARTDAEVTLTLTGDVVASTVEPAATLSRFDAGAADPAWEDVDLTGAFTFTPAAGDDPAALALTLPAVPTDTVSYRLVLRGDGPTPLVSLVDGRPVPFAGGAAVALPIT